MQNISPSDFYQNQLSIYQGLWTKTKAKISSISSLRLLFACIAIGFAFMSFNKGESMQWALTAIFTIFFLVLVRNHSKLHRQEKLYELQITILKRELQALEGNISAFAAGEEFIDSIHPYSFDLDIFGKGSVYQLLCRCVTQNGLGQLADQLKQPSLNKSAILQEQALIKELSAIPQFLQDFRVAGLSVPEEKEDYKRVRTWLLANDEFINSLLAKVAIVAMPTITAILIVLSFWHGTPNPYLALAVIVNLIIRGSFSKKIKLANIQIGKTSGLVEKYQQLQLQVAMQTFTSDHYRNLAADCNKSLQQIAQFQKLAKTFDSRNNSMVGPLMNMLFLFDIYCLLRLESWRKKHKDLLLQTMDEMIKLDVQVTLGTYAFNHPGNNYPTINEGSGVIATNLRHPLIAKGAVGNSFSLGKEEQFYLLTGANMTGKSTFIRTVGNSILMSYLGIPVAAERFSLPLLKLYTSIRVTDSVQDDVSYFRAELNRIKSVMEAVKESETPYLVLLDEPLRGTNSGDKQQGTRSIIESLLAYHSIGIVATHDIGLCSLETDYPGKVSNYHFESKVVDDGLSFDFRLYSGGSTSNNATILMRQMGIIRA